MCAVGKMGGGNRGGGKMLAISKRGPWKRGGGKNELGDYGREGTKKKGEGKRLRQPIRMQKMKERGLNLLQGDGPEIKRRICKKSLNSEGKGIRQNHREQFNKRKKATMDLGASRDAKVQKENPKKRSRGVQDKKKVER